MRVPYHARVASWPQGTVDELLDTAVYLESLRCYPEAYRYLNAAMAAEG